MWENKTRGTFEKQRHQFTNTTHQAIYKKPYRKRQVYFEFLNLSSEIAGRFWLPRRPAALFEGGEPLSIYLIDSEQIVNINGPTLKPKSFLTRGLPPWLILTSIYIVTVQIYYSYGTISLVQWVGNKFRQMAWQFWDRLYVLSIVLNRFWVIDNYIRIQHGITIVITGNKT